jgi:acetyl esterase/lipase
MAIGDAVRLSVEQDVVYGRGGDRDLLCDVYRPAPERTKQTAVVHLHGGGFRGGSKAGARLARPLAELGYTCVSASYRVIKDGLWPAPIHDAKAAIRWTRAHAAELGVASKNVVVLGYSAGGRLALIAAGTQNNPALEGDSGAPDVGTGVAACVAFYPPALAGDRAVLGPNPSETIVREFAPLTHVKPGYPPTLLLHGTADETMPVEESLALYDALRTVHAPVELHVIEGLTHIFDAHAEFAEASATWIDLFLDRHVAHPRTYPSTEPPAR